MIKVTVNSFSGDEFKFSKSVFIWFGFNQLDVENIGVILTFHNSVIEAQENNFRKTEKTLQYMLGIQDELTFKISEIPAFTDFETLKINIQIKLVEILQALNLSNINSFEII